VRLVSCNYVDVDQAARSCFIISMDDTGIMLFFSTAAIVLPLGAFLSFYLLLR
jgi:hypothetical protein